LDIPASSIKSESGFSEVGLITTKHRNRIKAEMIKNLLLRSNNDLY
jgi:hypothetical protein